MCKKTWCLLLAGVILTHSWPSRSELFRNKNIFRLFTGLDYCFTNFKTFSRIQGSVRTLPPPLCLINTKTKQLDCFPNNFSLSPKQKRTYFSFQLKIIIHNESANNTLTTLCLKETCLLVLPHIVIIVALCNTCRTFWWNCRTL